MRAAPRALSRLRFCSFHVTMPRKGHYLLAEAPRLSADDFRAGRLRHTISRHSQ